MQSRPHELGGRDPECVSLPAGSTWPRTFVFKSLFGVKNGKLDGEDSSGDERLAVNPMDFGAQEPLGSGSNGSGGVDQPL